MCQGSGASLLSAAHDCLIGWIVAMSMLYPESLHLNTLANLSTHCAMCPIGVQLQKGVCMKAIALHADKLCLGTS